MAQTLLSTQRQQHSITPSLITNRLHNICKHLHIGRQEDAHEFLRYLIEQMEKSYLNRFKSQTGFKEMEQYSKETTPLNQILGGYLRSTVTCLSCKHESITFQHFMDLPLDITRVSTLNEALAGYFARENLEECGYKCESCKKKVSATKRFTLERAPVVLCIQLKRFNVMGGKLGKPIQICQSLDLSKHLAKCGDQSQSSSYKLVSMVTHLGGSASGGHYTAIGLAPNGNFYHFDDSCVSSISTESVLKTNAYVLFYELIHTAKKQNGHNGSAVHTNFNYQNEHTYSKSAASSTSFAPRNDSREAFAKPTLPKMIPSSIIKQNNQIKQKENETTPPQPSRMMPSTSRAGATDSNPKVSTQLFPSVKLNGKREADDDDDEATKARKIRLEPSTSELPSSSTSSASPQKPKSLVPYETDDEDEEPSSTTNGNGKMSEADRVNFCRTSSGVFVETELKENSSPSKHGSTIDKTIITKASTTNGSATNGEVNGKKLTNGYHVKRNDDTIQQLTKLNHSGYGSSEVVSWNNTPSNMNREVVNDQYEDRKRQHEDDDDVEMDSGRLKKIKFGNKNQNHNGQGKLPNPFQEQQNAQNQNGYRPQIFFGDRPGNISSRLGYQNGSKNFRNGNGKFTNNNNFKPRDNYSNNYHQNGQNHRYNGNKFNGNKRHYDRR
jgi:ubiquitin carboxyl-terminal hydrolase 36/42